MSQNRDTQAVGTITRGQGNEGEEEPSSEPGVRPCEVWVIDERRGTVWGKPDLPRDGARDRPGLMEDIQHTT
ncbi:hypothetical protein FRC09_012852, partial [Ceratobasidium sp. 395]